MKNNTYDIQVVPISVCRYLISFEKDGRRRQFEHTSHQTLENIREFANSLTDVQIKELFKDK